MKRLYKFLSTIIALALLAACAVTGSAETPAYYLPQLDDYFTERDLSGDWDASATQIVLTGDTAVTASHVVSAEGGIVTIMDGGVYVLSGTLDDGTIVVDVKDDERVQLVLNGVSVTSSDSAAINVIQADKVFITLVEGTENTLANLNGFDEDGEIDAVIFSDEDLTFNGSGALVINSPAGDGIDGKDDVKFASGTYVITAAGRGVDANDSIRIAGGDFTVTTDGDAFRARHSSNADLGYIYIWGGSFSVTTGGGASNAAAKSGEMGFGGMPGGMTGGFGRRRSQNEDGDGMTPPDFQGSDGEMPEMPQFTDENGDGMTPPDFQGSDGEMPEMPQFTDENGDGEMPQRPESDGEAGETTRFGRGGGMNRGGFGFDGAASADTSDDENTVSAKGFKASGDIAILGGDFNLDTADDAFHANRDLLVFDGSLTIASGDDGIHADSSLTIAGGDVNITQSYEGLESAVIAIMGGNIALVASDDGLNAADSAAGQESMSAQEGVLIAISGGTLYVNAEGDGIDSNGDLTVTGGSVVVSGPSNGANGALDYNGTATISGGAVVAAGASGMAENFSDTSSQAAFLVSLNGEAGEIVVTDSAGSVVVSAAVEKSFATVVVSAPELVVGETYTVAIGDSTAEITLTDTVTGSDAGGFGSMGGGAGHMGRKGGTDQN